MVRNLSVALALAAVLLGVGIIGLSIGSTDSAAQAPPPYRIFIPSINSAPAAAPTPTPTVSPDATPIPMQMVSIPAGSFWMGCDPTTYQFNQCGSSKLEPASTGAYRIDKTEVTNGQYAECVAAGACAPPKRDYLGTRRPYYGNPLYVDYPVVNVAWSQAYSFCQWAGKRLPSEAEWEKAARGGDTRNYPWGNSLPTCDRANFRPGTSYCVGSTSAAGSYPNGASPYGVLDMAGNVTEWMSGSGRARGGSWEGSNIDQEIWNVRPVSSPDAAYTSYGIRCAANN